LVLSIFFDRQAASIYMKSTLSYLISGPIIATL